VPRHRACARRFAGKHVVSTTGYHRRRRHNVIGPLGQYLALVTKKEGTDANVVFPPGCVTAGRSLDEAAAFAQEALALHLQGLREDVEAPPAPSAVRT